MLALWLVIACGTESANPSDAAGEDEAPAADAPAERTTADDLAARVREELDCDNSVVRYLCAVDDLEDAPPDLPDIRTTWLGITVAVRDSRTLGDGALETAGLAQLTLTPEGVFTSSLRPTSGTEARLLGTILSNASLAAKGGADRIDVPQGLVDYLDVPPEAVWPVSRVERGWAFEGAQPARLYRAKADDGRPPAWVVVERGKGGAFLSIFPDVPWGVP